MPLTLSQTAVTAPLAPVSGALMKWHGGWWLSSDGGEGAAARQAKATAAAANGFVGFKGIYPWGGIESAQGVYDFSQVVADLSFCRGLGVRFAAEIWWNKFDVTSGDTDPAYFPPYLNAYQSWISNGPSDPTHGTEFIDLGQLFAAQRFAALASAMGTTATTGGFTLDTDPYFEQFIMTETAQLSTVTQFFPVIFPAVRTAFPHTAGILYCNFIDESPVNYGATLGTEMAQYLIGFGSPDCPWYTGYDYGSQIAQGIGVGNVQGIPANFGTVDYRGKLPISYSFQFVGGVPISTVAPYGVNTLRCTHLMCSYNPGASPGAGNSLADIIAARASYPIVNTACPSLFPGCNLS
jgi:hypothetical protein